MKFWYLKIEFVLIQMESEPEFCRDVIETRVKEVFREHLKISRDMPFTQVYRMEMPNAGEGDVVRPIVVAFRSARDRDNILRLVYRVTHLVGKNLPLT